MKIAIDIRSAAGEKAGKGWYTFNLVHNLLKLDWRNKYILYTNVGIPGMDLYKNTTVKIISGTGFFWHSKVAHDARTENVDIYFAPTSYITPALLPKNIKIVLAVHDLVAFLFPKAHNKKAVIIEKLLFKKALKKAVKICAVSENTKQDIIKRFKIASEKISVVGCAAVDDFKPIPEEDLKDFAKQTNLPEKFFLTVGTIEPRKNYINLIRAFALINKEFPNINLIIVGKNGWQFEKVYEEIEKNYLGGKVHVLGYLSGKSLTNLYNLAQALVFPSYYEGFGIPPLEAMKCLCPVIASKTSSIPEVVGDAGIYIDPNDPKNIAQAMAKFLKNPKLAEEMRAKGLIQSKKFSWKDSAKRLLEIFRSL